MTNTSNDQFQPGDKARTASGVVVTVIKQVGNTVYVYEGPLGWYHVSKLVKQSEDK
jgi:hypothetical protein